MRISIILLLLGILLAPFPLGAQTTDAANKRAGSWFMNDMDTFLNRSGSDGMAEALDLWEPVASKAIGEKANRTKLFLSVMPKCNPLFDSNNLLITNQVTKFAKRLEQLPPDIVK